MNQYYKLGLADANSQGAKFVPPSDWNAQNWYDYCQGVKYSRKLAKLKSHITNLGSQGN